MKIILHYKFDPRAVIIKMKEKEKIKYKRKFKYKLVFWREKNDEV